MKNIFIKIKNWFIKHKPSKRKVIQVYTALLYNANLKGFIKGEIFTGNSKVGCVPGLNCYSCPGAIGSCPLGSIQGALSKSDKKLPFYVFGIILLYGIILGRTICGWLCPVGLVQELIYKIKSKKLGKNSITRVLSYFKYVLLVVFVIVIPLAYVKANLPLPGFCKYICPAGIFEGALFLLVHDSNTGLFALLNVIFTWKFFLLVVFFVACIFIYRFFCRFICPLGAIYGLFNKFNILGVKVNKDSCIDCGLCVKECKMDVRKVGDHECINCGECIPVCPTKAIYYNGSKFKLNNTNEEVKVEVETNNEIKKDNKKTLKLLSQVGASVLLVGVLIYGYFGDQKAPTSDPNKAEIGKECKDFEFTVSYKDDVETYKLSEHKGKITILNFWNINCSSCIAEIPHFEEFYDNYKDDVNVIFVNPTDGKVKNDEFMFDNEWNTYDATFTTIDNETSQITSYFPIGTTFPHTVILDRNNIVREMVTAAMSYDTLEAYYNQYKGEISETSNKAEIGKACKDFEFTVSYKDNMETYKLSEHKGKITILNFWNINCSSCIAEIPHFEEFYDNYKDDVNVIFINPTDGKVKNDEFMLDNEWNLYDATFTTIDNETNQITSYFPIGTTFPHTVILDRDNIVREMKTAAMTYNALEAYYNQYK